MAKTGDLKLAIDRGVEILTPASGAKEFLMGDLPAIGISSTTGTENVAIDEASLIVMPLAPKVLIALGPSTAMRSISDDEVDFFNRLQVRWATDFLVHRPGALFDAETIASWRNSDRESFSLTRNQAL